MSVSPFPPPGPSRPADADGPSMQEATTASTSYDTHHPSSSSHAHFAPDEPFSSAAAYRGSMSPVSSPPPRPVSSTFSHTGGPHAGGFAIQPGPAATAQDRSPPFNSPPLSPSTFSHSASHHGGFGMAAAPNARLGSPPPTSAPFSPSTAGAAPIVPGYERPHPAKSPPPATSLVIQDPAVPPSHTSTPVAGTTPAAQRNNDGRSAKSSSKREGTPSISKSAKSSATSWYIGGPDSPVRVPSRNAALYILVSTVEAAIIITLVAFIFARIVTEVDDFTQNLKTVSVYLAVFVFGCVFQVLISWDAVRLKNTMQLIGVLIFNIALTVTAALEIRQIRDALNAQDRIEGGIPCADNPDQLCAARNLFPTVERYLIAVSGVCFVAEFFLIFLTYKLWKDFGWIIYQKIGADLRVRRMFFWYQLFIVFLKFAFFFGVGFTVIYLILVAQTTDWEYAVTIAAVPVAMVALFAAGFAVRREWTSLMIVSLLLMIAGLVYFVYKLTQVWVPATRDEYTYVRMTITFISGFAILMLVLTLLNGFICLFNFKKGLKPAHDAIGTFGGVHRQRVRKDRDGGATDAENTTDLDGNVEPKENGMAYQRQSVADPRRGSMLQSPVYNSYGETMGGRRRSSAQPFDVPHYGNAPPMPVPATLQPGAATPVYAPQPVPTTLHPGVVQSPPPGHQVYHPQPPTQPYPDSAPLKPSASRVSLD